MPDDCAPQLLMVAAGELRSAASSWSGAVVVGVSPRDRRAARRELGAVQMFELDASRPLEELAEGVLVVPGRCVILARRAEQGWQVAVTPGGWRETDILPPVPAPVLDPVPMPPEEVHAPGLLWVGVGAGFGFPNLASGLVAFKVGPAIFEASLTPLLLYIDAYWRLGLSLPLPVRLPPVERIELGVSAGPRSHSFFIFMGQSGTTYALTVDGYFAHEPHLGVMGRLSLGVDHYTEGWEYHGPARAAGWVPSVQVGAVLVFGE